MGIWTEAWDDGVFEWKPLTLKAKIFPVDNVDVAGLLAELVVLNFIRQFEAGGKNYGVVRNFRLYQRPKKPNSSGKLPNCLDEYAGPAPTSSEPVPNHLPTSGENSPQMEDGGGKGKKEPNPESKSSTTNVRSVDKPTRQPVDSHFEEFWKAYPHRGEAADPKKPAKEKFDRAVKRGADPAAIIAGAKRFAEIEHRAGRAGTEKVAQAATWLNQERWNDYPALPAAGTGPPSSQVFVAIHSEEWEAWQAASSEKLKPIDTRHHGLGRYFPARWPTETERAA
ncbi:hypothetical protein B5U99_29170 [Bosea sp. Tri-54]|nr:hypothetical protein BLM15_07660 [Bosea sp. Tri-49]RXT32709.1 hypothetical protein B5U99_29170 [Bosea sp. Tri-54]